MNVLLLFGFRHTPYILRLAELLHDHDRVNRIGGLVSTVENFEMLKEQTAVPFDELHCIPLLHRQILEQGDTTTDLDALEEEYGFPSLWPYLIADRRYIRLSHEEQQHLIEGWFDFYLDLFEAFEPDLYLAYAVAASHTWIPYILTAERGGTAVAWKSTRVRSRYELMINDAMDNFPRTFERFHSLSRGEETVDDYPVAHANAIDFLESFRESEGVRPSYFSAADVRKGIRPLLSGFSAPYRAAKYVYQNRMQNDYIAENPFKPTTAHLVLERVKAALRTAYVSYSDIFQEPDENEPFVLFPLHQQPEASTSLLAPMYVDQPALVTQIARSIPLEYSLYVKEHPTMIGRRPISYYERFSHLSNVRLIGPWVDSHRLIQDSELVTTITGTAGLEALFYEKPVMTFGEPHYNELNMVLQGGDPDHFSEKIFQGIFTREHDETELIQYLTALFEESFEMPVVDVSSGRDATPNAAAIYDEIVPFLDA